MEITLEKALKKQRTQEAKIQEIFKQNKEFQEKIKSLQFQNENLQTKITKAEEKTAYYIQEYDRVIEAFKQAQRARFGSKSERFVDDQPGNEQLSLFDDSSQKNIPAPKDDANVEHITYTRKKKGSKKPDLSKIPVREVIIPISAEDKVCSCGNTKEVIRYEKKSKLNYAPAVFEIIIEKREVVACRKGCVNCLVTAKAPERVLPKSKATESLLAYIAVSKVLDRQPLYHLEKKLEQRY